MKSPRKIFQREQSNLSARARDQSSLSRLSNEIRIHDSITSRVSAQDKGQKLRIRIASFLLNLIEFNQIVEVNRQFLNSIVQFEPYAAYLRILRDPNVTPDGKTDNSTGQNKERQTKGITAQNLADFLKQNGFETSYASIKSIVTIFDSSLEGKIDFEDFLKMVLSQQSPQLRFDAALKPIFEVPDEGTLTQDLEYVLARFFWKISTSLERISSDKEVTLTLSTQNLIYLSSSNFAQRSSPDSASKMRELGSKLSS